MKVSEIESQVVKFCETEGIPIIRGRVAEEHALKIKRFLAIQKQAYKNKRRMERREPQLIKDIKIL